MKSISKILKWLGALLLLLIIAIIAVPFLFKGKILDFAKTAINDELNATVEFKDVDLSLIRSFPNFSICLEDYSVEGKDEFEKINLAKGKNACIEANFWSVVNTGDGLEIKSISLIEPDVNIVVNRNGKANYDIAIPSEETTTSEAEPMGAYELQLSNYNIQNGNISYFDKSSNMYLNIKNLNHEGVGKFTEEVFDLITETKMDQLTFSSGGVNYMSKAKLDLDAIFNINLTDSKYTLKENKLKINALQVNADGFVQTKADDLIIDFKFDTPSNSLKELISLVPGAYTKDYDQVKADGQVKFDGMVKGTYNANRMPSFSVNTDIKNGNVQYPGMPLGISNVNTTFNVKSPSSNLDDMVLDMPTFKFKVGNNPLEGRLFLKTLLSDPNIDTQMKGILNLSEFAQAFPMESVEKIAGIIDADFKVISSLSQIESGKYDEVNMDGSLSIKDLVYNAKSSPSIRLNSVMLDFLPQFLKINEFDSVLGKSDLKVSGKIDNFLAWFAPDKTMRGDLVIRSSLFDVNEWMSEEEDQPSTARVPAEPTSDEEVFDRFDFDLDAKFANLKYADYEIRDLITDGNFTPNKMNINLFGLLIGNSDLQGEGNLKNVFDYVFDNGTLTGDLSLSSRFLDINQFMTEEEGTAKTISGEDELEPFLVPENIDIDITSDIDKLLYTDIELRKVKGLVDISDKQIKLKNIKGNTLGAGMTINGSYNTVDPEKPLFDLKYNISQMDFGKAFDKFNTVKILMPIAKYIDGRFSTDMSFNGVLGKDMMPDMNSLTADGFMQTFDAIVNNFKPLEELGKKLNVKFFKNMKLQNSKNWFTVKDGKVIFKEAKHKVKDIDMLVSGTHGLDENMDYDIKAKIPRKLLGGGTVGKAANQGLDFLNKEASKLGVSITDGEFINVLINFTGTMLKPVVKVTPLGAEGETVKKLVENVVEAVKDTVTAVVKTKIDDTKKLASAEKAKLEAEAAAKIKKIKADANKQIAKVKQEAKRNADKAKKMAYDEADRLAAKAGTNPLKKIAAKKAAEIAKKEADKVHRNSLNKVNAQVEKIRARSDKEAEKVKLSYDKRIEAVEKKAGI